MSRLEVIKDHDVLGLIFRTTASFQIAYDGICSAAGSEPTEKGTVLDTGCKSLSGAQRAGRVRTGPLMTWTMAKSSAHL